jgi:hypothetical protein
VEIEIKQKNIKVLKLISPPSVKKRKENSIYFFFFLVAFLWGDTKEYQSSCGGIPARHTAHYFWGGLL